MNAPEFLTVEEYADRLKVSRTTVFSWLKNGELREGADYFRRGRIVRFRWPPFPTKPQPQTAEDADRKPQRPTASPCPRKQTQEERGTGPAINLDY